MDKTMTRSKWATEKETWREYIRWEEQRGKPLNTREASWKTESLRFSTSSYLESKCVVGGMMAPLGPRWAQSLTSTSHEHNHTLLRTSSNITESNRIHAKQDCNNKTQHHTESKISQTPTVSQQHMLMEAFLQGSSSVRQILVEQHRRSKNWKKFLFHTKWYPPRTFGPCFTLAK